MNDIIISLNGFLIFCDFIGHNPTEEEIQEIKVVENEKENSNNYNKF